MQAHLNAVAQATAIHAECIVGGMATQKQKRLLRRRPQVIVATPGRLSALLGMGEEAERPLKTRREPYINLYIIRIPICVYTYSIKCID